MDIGIQLHDGRTTIAIGTYPVDCGEAWAKARVIDQIVRCVLEQWPSVVYSEQIENLVRCACKSQRAE
ncbi:MAG TPA: hypothetical protein VH639_05575 [Bryobacteraceae bacterium]